MNSACSGRKDLAALREPKTLGAEGEEANLSRKRSHTKLQRRTNN